jgi:hypothetical protein
VCRLSGDSDDQVSHGHLGFHMVTSRVYKSSQPYYVSLRVCSGPQQTRPFSLCERPAEISTQRCQPMVDTSQWCGSGRIGAPAIQEYAVIPGQATRLASRTDFVLLRITEQMTNPSSPQGDLTAMLPYEILRDILRRATFIPHEWDVSATSIFRGPFCFWDELHLHAWE